MGNEIREIEFFEHTPEWKYFCEDNISKGELSRIFGVSKGWIDKVFTDNKYKESFSVMTRTFLEFTVDDYGYGKINEYKEKRNDNHFTLRSRILLVSDDLYNKGKLTDKELNTIKTTIDYEKSPVKMEALNQYVHNYKLSPDEQSLKVFWDNMRPLFERIWS